tara:strand:- start:20 stop:610 length:591 start_codon:yes stop_codon:yes gene_type:complete
MMGSSPAKAKTNPKISLGMGKEADANLSKKVNAKTGKGAVSLRDAKGGRGSLDFWNQSADEVKVASKRAAREHYVANDNFSKNKKPANFNMKGGKTTTPGYSTTKGANKGLPKNFNATGTSKAGKLAKVAKKVVGKAGKFLGGKTLGVVGMLMSTSSKADQPTNKQKNQNQFKKPDFKAINKDLAKSMYKPLPKNK